LIPKEAIITEKKTLLLKRKHYYWKENIITLLKNKYCQINDLGVDIFDPRQNQNLLSSSDRSEQKASEKFK